MNMLRAAALLLAAAVCLASAKPTSNTAPTPVYPPPYITIVKELRSYPDDGKFSSYFEASNGIAVALEGSKKAYEGTAIIRGNYSYVQEDGSQAEVTFVADENGYQPSSDLLPVGPPIPAHSLLQIEKARLEGSDESSEEISLYYSAPRTYTTTSAPRAYTRRSYTTTTTEGPLRYTPPPTTTTKRPRSYTRRTYTTSTTQKPRSYTTTTEEPSSPEEDSSEEVVLAYTTTTAEPTTKRRRTYTRAPTTTSTTSPIPLTNDVPEEDSSEEEITTTELPSIYTAPDEDSSEELTVSVTEAPVLYTPPEEASVEDDSQEEVIAPLAYSPPEEPESEEDSTEEKTTTTTELPLAYNPPQEAPSAEDVSEEDITTTTTELPSEEVVSEEESAEELPVTTALPLHASDEGASSEEIIPSTTSTTSTTRRPYRYLRYSTARSEEYTTTTTEPSTTTRRRYTKPYYLQRFTTPKPFIYRAPTIYFAPRVRVSYSSLTATDNSDEILDSESEKTSDEETQEVPAAIITVEETSDEISSETTLGAVAAPNTFTVVQDDGDTDDDERDDSSEQNLTTDAVISEAETLPVNAVSQFTVISDDDQVDSSEVLDVTQEETVSSEDSSLSFTLKVLADNSLEPIDEINTGDEDDSLPGSHTSTESVAEVTEPSFKTLEDVFQEIGRVVQSLASRELSDEVLITEAPTVAPLQTQSVGVPRPRFVIVQSTEDLSLDLTSNESLFSLETVTESAEIINSNENSNELFDDLSDETLEPLSFEDGTVLDISSEEIGLSLTTEAAASTDDTERAPFKTLDDVFAEINSVVDSLNSQETEEVIAIPAAPETSAPTFTVVQSDENLSLDLLSNESPLSSEERTVGLIQALITGELSAAVNKTSEIVSTPVTVESAPASDSVSSEIVGVEVTIDAASDEILAAPDSVSNEVEVEVTADAASGEVLSEVSVDSSETPSVELLNDEEQVPSLETIVDDTSETTDGPQSVEQLLTSYLAPSV